MSRWSPRRARFAQAAPHMADVVRRVDVLPDLADFWATRWPFAADEAR